ncbi:transporter LiaF [Paenibacillus sp. JCM 10914]|nr:transporter LiaF [Paenibacillus sp. JCM 10914]
MSRKGWSQFSTGLLLIGIGALFLLNQLGVIDISIGYIFSTFWPVILIYFGLQSLIYARGGALWGSIVPIVIGSYFLANNLGVVHFSFGDLIKYAIPIILIGFGLQVILRPKDHTPPPSPPSPDDFGPQRREEMKFPEPPEARPLDSSFDEEFERRFGKADKTPIDSEPTSEHDTAGRSRGYRWQEQGTERHRQEGRDRSRFRVEIDLDDDHHNNGHKHNHEEYHEHDNYSWHGHDTVNKSSFIGDVHMGKDYFQLKPTNISQFIGDTVLDLTKAQIPYGETKINISAFIGDVKVFVPNDTDVGIQVNTNSFIGDMKVLEESRSGFMSNAGLESPYYREAGKKIRITVSVFIGDVKVNKVG